MSSYIISRGENEIYGYKGKRGRESTDNFLEVDEDLHWKSIANVSWFVTTNANFLPLIRLLFFGP